MWTKEDGKSHNTMKCNLTKATRLAYFIGVTILVLSACDGKKSPPEPSQPVETFSPVLRCETPAEDSITHTFTLRVSADSTAGATAVFHLLDGVDTLMSKEGQDATFSGVMPLDEGYNVIMEVRHADSIFMRKCHVAGFVLKRQPVKAMTAEELEELINAKDKTIALKTNPRLAPTVVLTYEGNVLNRPQKLSEVIDCIEWGEWKSVKVKHVGHDDNNLVDSITLTPVGEQSQDDIMEEDEDYSF